MRKKLILPSIFITLILAGAGVLIYQNVRKSTEEKKEAKVEEKKEAKVEEKKDEVGRTTFFTNSTSNVRSCASTSCNVVGQYPQNTKLELSYKTLEDLPDWIEGSFTKKDGSSQKVFFSKIVLSLTPSPTSPTTPTPTKPAPSPKPTATFSTYSNPQFSIKYPSHWKIDKGTTDTSFYQPGAIRDIDFEEDVSVSAIHTADFPFKDLNGFTTFMSNLFPEIFTDYKLTETTSIPLGGHLGHKLVFSGVTPDGLKIKGLAIVTVVDNTAYSILYFAKEGEYSTNLKNAQEMIDSFRVLGQAEPTPAPPAPDLVNYSTYSGPSFSLQYPSKAVQENLDNGVSFTTPARLAIVINEIEFTDDFKGLTIEEIGDIFSEGYAAAFGNFTVTKKGTALISGVKSSLTNFTAEINGSAITGFSGIIVKNDKIFSLFTLADPDVYAASIEQVQKLVETFTIK